MNRDLAYWDKIHEVVGRTTAAQDLPQHVDDGAVLRRIARLLNAPPKNAADPLVGGSCVDAARKTDTTVTAVLHE